MKQMVALVFLIALISVAPQGGFALFSARPVAAAAFDEFGIQQLYPSVTEGLTWDSEHWSNGNPRTLTSDNWDADDPSGWSHHAGSQCIAIDGNGVMIFNKACGGSIHPRLYMDPVTNDGKKFKNVEITGYHMRVKDADLSYGGFAFGARGGPFGHGPTDPCTATTYYGQLKNNGGVAFTKELVHPTSRGKGIQQLFPDGLPYNVWIGLKFVVYNINNDSQVKLELYIDQSDGLNGGDWQLIGEFVDDGNWSGGVDDKLAGCMEQGLFPDGEFHVITEGNGVVFIRDTDVDDGRYKWLTVREIAAAPGNEPPTLVSLSITPTSPSILVGNTQQFTAAGTYSDATTADITNDVTWTSFTTTVATIAVGGLATAVAEGTTTISATSDTVVGSTTLIVTPAPPPTLVSITVMPVDPSIIVDSTQQFTAAGTYSDATTADITNDVKWISSTTTVATIAVGGLATAVAEGITTISATSGTVVGSTTLAVTRAPEDVVTIKKAQYRSKARRLQVAAESTDPAAELRACRDVSSVCNASSDSFLGVFVDGKLNIKITSPPSGIRVDSDRGGYATAIVVIK